MYSDRVQQYKTMILSAAEVENGWQHKLTLWATYEVQSRDQQSDVHSSDCWSTLSFCFWGHEDSVVRFPEWHLLWQQAVTAQTDRLPPLPGTWVSINFLSFAPVFPHNSEKWHILTQIETSNLYTDAELSLPQFVLVSRSTSVYMYSVCVHAAYHFTLLKYS